MSASIWVAYHDGEMQAFVDMEDAVDSLPHEDSLPNGGELWAREYVPVAAIEKTRGERGNLIMLVERLSRRLPDGDKTRLQALDYLKRIGHVANILREATK